jgi:hypothetical protein
VPTKSALFASQNHANDFGSAEPCAAKLGDQHHRAAASVEIEGELVP